MGRAERAIMAYAGVVDDLRACCAGQQPNRLPVLALGLEFGAEAVGMTCAQSRSDVDGMVRCQVESVRRFGFDLVEVFPDDYIEFEPLGLRMSADPDRPTMPLAYLPLERDTLRRFRLPDPQRDLRLPIHLEMLRRTKAALGDTACVLGRIAAPFSTLGLVYGIDTLLVAMLTEPDLVHGNLRFFIDHQILFGQAQLEAGADLLWLGDCVADSKFLRTEHFAEFAFAAAARVAEALTGAGGLVIYHTCETSLPHLAWQVQLPVSAVNVGEGVDMAAVKQALGTRRCLTGNFDPMMLRDGTPEAVAAAAMDLVQRAAPGGGYVFNTGEGVMRTSPPANVLAMMRAAREASDRVQPPAMTLESPGIGVTPTQRTRQDSTSSA
jgi:uroporphyrinogen decarboxylase